MEAIGVFAFCILISYSGLPGRVSILERKIRNTKNDKEKIKMSKMIKELTGKKCNIEIRGVFTEVKPICHILEVDDEWVKIEETKNKNKSIELIRIDDISKIKLIQEK